MLGLQQGAAERLAGHAGGLDGREDVERALRLKAGQPQVVEALDHQPAAHVVLFPHLLDLVVALPQGHDGGVLAGGGGAHDGALVDLGHSAEDGFRPAGVAQPPAGHGVALGKAVDHHRPLPHPGQGGDGHVPGPVGQLGVDLVRQDDDAGAPQHLGHGLQILPGHHRAGGVVGVGHDEQLGAGGDGLPQRLGGQAELVLGLAGQVDRHAPRQGGDGVVADKAGLGDDDLVPRGHQGADAHVDGLAAPHRDQDLPHGVVAQVHPALQVAGDLDPQLLQAGVGGVLGVAHLQRFDACLPDGPGGLEIGLAHAQADALGHFGGQVEKFADAGRTHGRRGRRDQLIVIHHSTIHSLSSISSSW